MSKINLTKRLILSCPCCQIGKINPGQYRDSLTLNAPLGLFDFSDNNEYYQSFSNAIEEELINEIIIFGNCDCLMLKKALEFSNVDQSFYFQSKISGLQKQNDTPLKIIKRISEATIKSIYKNAYLRALIQQNDVSINIELISSKKNQTLINYSPNVGIHDPV